MMLSFAGVLLVLCSQGVNASINGTSEEGGGEQIEGISDSEVEELFLGAQLDQLQNENEKLKQKLETQEKIAVLQRLQRDLQSARAELYILEPKLTLLQNNLNLTLQNLENATAFARDVESLLQTELYLNSTYDEVANLERQSHEITKRSMEDLQTFSTILMNVTKIQNGRIMNLENITTSMDNALKIRKEKEILYMAENSAYRNETLVQQDATSKERDQKEKLKISLMRQSQLGKTKDRSFPISETCISTPLAYKELFEEIQFNIDVPPQCVSQNLFTTIQGPYGDGCPLNGNPLPPTVSKYATSTWGWASPSINLEVYLAMASRHPFDPFSTVAEMCKYVGFTDDQVHQDCSYTLAVFDREKARQNGLFAPTWAAWFPRLNDYFGLSFTWEVQKELVLGGFEDFDHLTGCHNRTVSQNASCSPDFLEAWKLCKASFYNGTEACATKFGSAYGGGLTASAAHTRAFLLACMDANPMFTGVGYGWDGIDYTGPEFLVDNVNLEDDLGAVRFLLYSPSSSSNFHRESNSSSLHSG